MADVVCLGELLIDFVPTVSGTSLVDAPAFPMASGGGYAVPVSARRSGGCVHLTRDVTSPVAAFVAAFKVEAIDATGDGLVAGLLQGWLGPGWLAGPGALADGPWPRALPVCQRDRHAGHDPTRRDPRAAGARAGPKLARPPSPGARYAA
jgi:sugar/nucleoside kinase (ribokinase family)